MYYSIQSIIPIANNLKAKGQKIVLATGFFDLLHAEHINFLHRAKEKGGILIVAVESDERARKVKGEGRPIQTQSLRCDQLSNLMEFTQSTDPTTSHQLVNYIISLPPDFDNQVAYESLIQAVRPDVYAVSSHTSYLENKQSLVEKYGGKLVVVHPWNPEVSTTQIISSRGPRSTASGQEVSTTQIISERNKV